jgi:predicted nucleotidyltransferase
MKRAEALDDIVEVAAGLVVKHPAVTSVELAGSRARGTYQDLSDSDFAVHSSDFAAVARDLPTLAAPLDPLGETTLVAIDTHFWDWIWWLATYRWA